MQIFYKCYQKSLHRLHVVDALVAGSRQGMSEYAALCGIIYLVRLNHIPKKRSLTA